jgi:hypothetical protein
VVSTHISTCPRPPQSVWTKKTESLLGKVWWRCSGSFLPVIPAGRRSSDAGEGAAKEESSGWY